MVKIRETASVASAHPVQSERARRMGRWCALDVRAEPTKQLRQTRLVLLARGSRVGQWSL